MQKKTQSLKLGVLLLTLLGIVGITFAGRYTSTLANSYHSFTASPSSTACAGNNNSDSSDSDCNTNTPDPSPGSCQLAWIDGGGGSVSLDTSQVTDKGLQQTLKDYNLRCASDVKASSSYTLVPEANDSGNPKLDLANVMNRSPWIYQQLNNKFGLNCNSTPTPTPTPTPQETQNGPKQSGGYFYIVSGLDGSLYLDIQHNNGHTGTVGVPIIAFTKNVPASNNQLWRFVPDGNDTDNENGYGFIQSKGNHVLDIKGGSTTSGTPVIAFGKSPLKSPPANQLWKFVSSEKGEDDHGYIQSKSGLVLTLPTDSSGTPLTASSKKVQSSDQSPSPDQIWHNVSQS